MSNLRHVSTNSSADTTLAGQPSFLDTRRGRDLPCARRVGQAITRVLEVRQVRIESALGARPMNYRNDISAGVIVFHRGPDGCRFLLLLSRLTKRPLWEFPKGGVDEGESLRAAAFRELTEETGLGAKDVKQLPEFERREDYRFSAGDGKSRTMVRTRVTYFLAEARHVHVTLSAAEASAFAWLTLEDATKRIRYKARRAILADAAAVAGCGGVAPAQSETSSRSRDARRRSDSVRA
jgi:8-oxo-dGTP pyrophosphatase MutT (NUDIX family)